MSLRRKEQKGAIGAALLPVQGGSVYSRQCR